MKQILLFIAAFIFKLSFCQMPIEKDTKFSFKFHCLGTIRPTPVLIVVDGVMMSDSHVSILNPNDILSIKILKDQEGYELYGAKAINGVIIIETRSQTNTRLLIKDSLIHHPIPSATITIFPKFSTDSIVMISDDSGFVVTNKLQVNTEYKMKVTAIGYKNDVRRIKAGEKAEIILQRNVVMLPEVTITSIEGRGRRCHGCFGYVSSYRYQVNNSINALFKIFPNPAHSNSNLHIQLNQNESGNFYLQLFNASGQTVFNKEVYVDAESKLLSVDLPNLETGNYFVKLTNKDSGKFFSSKLIIK